MRTVTLVVFGDERARRDWLRGQGFAGLNVRMTDGVVTQGEHTWIAQVVRDKSDYQRLMGLELSDVLEHPAFMPPTDNWREFIACRIRLPKGAG